MACQEMPALNTWKKSVADIPCQSSPLLSDTCSLHLQLHAVIFLQWFFWQVCSKNSLASHDWALPPLWTDTLLFRYLDGHCLARTCWECCWHTLQGKRVYLGCHSTNNDNHHLTCLCFLSEKICTHYFSIKNARSHWQPHAVPDKEVLCMQR